MSEFFRYKLITDLRIEKEQWSGRVENGQPVENEGYWQSRGNYDQLTVREEQQLGSLDFLGVMKVLGQLHDAIQQIKGDAEK